MISSDIHHKFHILFNASLTGTPKIQYKSLEKERQNIKTQNINIPKKLVRLTNLITIYSIKTHLEKISS